MTQYGLHGIMPVILSQKLKNKILRGKMKSDYFVLGYCYKAVIESAISQNYTFTIIAETLKNAENILEKYVAYPDKVTSLEQVYNNDSGILIDKKFIKKMNS